MQAEDRVRLQHMVEAAQAAQRFMAGRDRAALDDDQMLLFAVVRALEIVGEAATRVSPETRAATPGVPWQAIIGMRNRVVHAFSASTARWSGRRSRPNFRSCCRPFRPP